MTLMNKVYQKVAKQLNLDVKDVKKVYIAYWEYIKNHIQQLPLKENINEEEFNKLRTHVNISSLGHLSCSYRRMLGVKKMINYRNERYKSTKSNSNV